MQEGYNVNARCQSTVGPWFFVSEFLRDGIRRKGPIQESERCARRIRTGIYVKTESASTATRKRGILSHMNDRPFLGVSTSTVGLSSLSLGTVDE
jgi:hypothetical protein